MLLPVQPIQVHPTEQQHYRKGAGKGAKLFKRQRGGRRVREKQMAREIAAAAAASGILPRKKARHEYSEDGSDDGHTMG